MSSSEDRSNLTALFDINVETFASTLINPEGQKSNYALHDLVIQPTGMQHRRSGSDIDDIKKKYYEHVEVLLLKVNRKGFYDTLPERLFLKLEAEHDTPTKRTKALKNQELEARNFFLPFEQAVYTSRIAIESIEQKYSNRFPDFFLKIWGLDKFQSVLTEEQTFLLCHLIPEAYRTVGNWQLTSLIFESILNKPIDLKFVAPKRLSIPSNKKAGGEINLGEDVFLGGDFQDEFPLLSIVVKGVTSKELNDFLPNGPKRIILEEVLCAYFISIDVPYDIELEVTQDSLDFILGEAVTGYNMMIN